MIAWCSRTQVSHTTHGVTHFHKNTESVIFVAYFQSSVTTVVVNVTPHTDTLLQVHTRKKWPDYWQAEWYTESTQLFVQTQKHQPKVGWLAQPARYDTVFLSSFFLCVIFLVCKENQKQWHKCSYTRNCKRDKWDTLETDILIEPSQPVYCRFWFTFCVSREKLPQTKTNRESHTTTTTTTTAAATTRRRDWESFKNYTWLSPKQIVMQSQFL